VNGEGAFKNGGEASSRQLLFSSCGWVRSTKTPPARSDTAPSQTASCGCSILDPLDARSWINTPTTSASRPDSVNLSAPWPRGAALLTPARLHSGGSPPFLSFSDIWPLPSPSPLIGTGCQTKTMSPSSWLASQGHRLRSSRIGCTPPSIYFSTAPSLAGGGFGMEEERSGNGLGMQEERRAAVLDWTRVVARCQWIHPNK
jgi:hypothetical protein